jgi:glucose-1-phosphate adenylyltransferase
MKQHVKAIISAGGIGSRLQPLTEYRPKPIVPIGKRRLIDFPISNALASDEIDQIEILCQAGATQVIRYIEDTYVTHRVPKPVRCHVAPMLTGEEYFKGNADAVRQIKSLFNEGHKDFLVLCADHVYVTKFDQMIEFHRQQKTAITIVVKRLPAVEAANRFGVFAVDSSGAVISVDEKPSKPRVIPGTTDCFASLGMYIFDTEKLQQLLGSCKGNDFGGDIIPYAFRHGVPISLFEYDGTWFDVGTVRSLWDANMELVGPNPGINLYDFKHPIFHKPRHLPSPKFVDGCHIHDNAIIGDGSIVSGEIISSVFSTRVRVGLGSVIKQSVILDNVQIGCDVRLTKVVIDKHSQIGDGVILGENLDEEIRRYPAIQVIDEIVVVPRNSVINLVS